jgi:hypothetical protein
MPQMPRKRQVQVTDAQQDHTYEAVPEHVRILMEQEQEKDAELLEIVDKLKTIDSKCPDITDLKHWESLYGKVYLSKIHDDEPKFYLWRVLLRLEWKEMLGLNINDDYLRQETIIKKCLLYPKPDENFIYKAGAGILPTLEKQIMYKSGFVSVEEALARISVIV